MGEGEGIVREGESTMEKRERVERKVKRLVETGERVEGRIEKWERIERMKEKIEGK